MAKNYYEILIVFNRATLRAHLLVHYFVTNNITKSDGLETAKFSEQFVQFFLLVYLDHCF